MPDDDTSSTPSIEIYYAYAPEDAHWVQELDKHLTLLKRQGLITTWHARLIQAGQDWQHVTDTHLENASVILLLISSDFLTSDYCYGVEMQRALQQQQEHGVRVIPVLLRPVIWKEAPFGHLQPLPGDESFVSEWPDRDRALMDVAAGIRRALEDRALRRLALRGGPVARRSNVPYVHNPFFLGREAFLTQLRARFLTSHGQRQAINGLGGLGKTQLAVEYVHRYREEYQTILWVRAENAESLGASFGEIAELLDLPEREAEQQEQVVQAVLRWLQGHRKWLLVLDNADEPELVAPCLPASGEGHVLLTTRATALRQLGIAQPLALSPLSPAAGALLVLTRAGWLPPDADLESASPQDRALGLQIAWELGALPLALDQAGAYLESTGMSLEAYLHLYQQHRAELLREHRGRDHSHPEPVATTWLLSCERVEARNPAAAELLRLCAFFAPDAIPELLLKQTGAGYGPVLSPVAGNGYQLEKALEALRAYSLLTRDTVHRTVSVHRLVQHVVRESLETEVQRAWQQRVIGLMELVFPDPLEVKAWTLCEQLLPHALLSLPWVEEISLASPGIARWLDRMGYYLNHRGRYVAASPVLRMALAMREKLLGPEHPDTAQTLVNLAYNFHHQARYVEAEPLLKRALTIQVQALGQEHAEPALTMNALALLLRDQGKYTEAEALYQQALAIRERVLGPEHPETAQSLSNLAWLYRNQGRYAEARPLYERSLAIREKALGPMHPETATSLNGLALLYQREKNYDQARVLYERVLQIREQTLGPSHQHTAQSLNSLANLYLTQDKLAQAEPLLRRALRIREEALGGEHRDTAQNYQSLGSLAQTQKQYREAEDLYQKALGIREHVLGAEHPATATSLHALGMLAKEQGRYAVAREYLQRALAVRERVLGMEHEETRKTREGLANVVEKLS